MLSEDGIAEIATWAGPLADKSLLIDLWKRCRKERSRAIGDLHHRGAGTASDAPESPVEHLAGELYTVVTGSSEHPILLLLGEEFAVVVVVAAVHAPQPNIVREGLVVVVSNAEHLPALRALPSKESIVVKRDADAEHDFAVVMPAELHSLWKPESAHERSMQETCDIEDGSKTLTPDERPSLSIFP